MGPARWVWISDLVAAERTEEVVDVWGCTRGDVSSGLIRGVTLTEGDEWSVTVVLEGRVNGRATLTLYHSSFSLSLLINYPLMIVLLQI